MKRFALALIMGWALANSVTGQTNITMCLTNSALLSGELVRETETNVVVKIAGVDTAFDKNQIRWQERANPPRNSQNSTTAVASTARLSPGPTPQAGAAAVLAGPADMARTMEAVRQSVLGPHAGAGGYQKANTYYQQTMNGVLNGTVTQDDLVAQAKQVLADCDKYKPERERDPQYEDQIAKLRDFVRRSDAGEKFDFNPAP